MMNIAPVILEFVALLARGIVGVLHRLDDLQRRPGYVGECLRRH